MAGMKKIFLKNATQISLHERFTFLRQPARTDDRVQAIRANLALQQQASARNRRLAAQMERRPAVMAALKIKQKSLRQRLGASRVPIADRLARVPVSQRIQTRVPVRSQSVGRSPRGNQNNRVRLTVGARGRPFRTQTYSPGNRQNSGRRFNGRQRGNLTRSQSVGNLVRSQSTGNLNAAGRFQPTQNWRGQNRFSQTNRTVQSRPQRGMNKNNRGFNRNANQRSFRQGNNNFRVQDFGGPRFNPNQRGRGNRGARNNFRRGGRFAGGQGNRGRGARGRGAGGRGGRNQNVKPSKEELDMQLDQYMASTKSTLDRELDTYMKQEA